MSYLVTSDDDPWKSLQQRNKIKGIAQEKLVNFTFRQFGYHIRDEEEIKQIVSEVLSRLKGRYLILKRFEVDSYQFKRGEYFLVSDVPKGIHLITERYSRQKIPPRISGITDEELVQILKNKKYIRDIYESLSRKRLDFWNIIDGNLIIYESKNKEMTKLYYSNVWQVLEYSKELMKYLKVQKATIIANGWASKALYKYLRELKEKTGLTVYIKDLYNWMNYFYKKKGKTLSEIRVEKIGKKFHYWPIVTDKFPEQIKIRFGVR